MSTAWLSHIPPQRFEEFCSLVRRCLSEAARVFLIDELPAAAAIERSVDQAAAPVVERQLCTGARSRTVKVCYEPEDLASRLSALGWQAVVHRVGWRFFYAVATAMP